MKNSVLVHSSFFCLIILCPILLSAHGEPTADEIVQSVLANRPAGDLRLKGRLFRLEGADRKRDLGSIEILMKPGAAETRTVIRAIDSKSEHTGKTLLIIQPADSMPRLYLAQRGRPSEEISGERLKESFAGTNFSYEDLNLAACLYWPKRKLVGTELVRGQACYKIEFTAPRDAVTQYSKVIAWIEKERRAVVKTEAFEADGRSVRKLSISALKKVKTAKGNELWTLRAVEVLWRPPNQALPDAEKTRIEIGDGEYEIELPSKFFAPETLGDW